MLSGGGACEVDEFRWILESPPTEVDGEISDEVDDLRLISTSSYRPGMTCVPCDDSQPLPFVELALQLRDENPWTIDTFRWMKKVSKFHGNVLNQPKEEGSEDTFISRLIVRSGFCWDLHGVYQRFHRLRLLLRFWCRARHWPGDEVHDVKVVHHTCQNWHMQYPEDVPEGVVQCMQRGSPWLQNFIDNPEGIHKASQYQLMDSRTVVFRCSAPEGGYGILPVVPLSERKFLDLAIRSTHRRQLHAGPHGTVAALEFHCRGIYQLCKQFCNRCYQRQVKGARSQRAWIGEPQPQLRDLSPDALFDKGPFAHSFCDYMSVGRKVHIIFLFCMMSQFVHAEITTSENAATTIANLKKFKTIRPSMECVYSDQASYFRNTFPEKVLDATGLRWELFPSRAPWCAGVAARCQVEFLKLWRTRLRPRIYNALEKAPRVDKVDGLFLFHEASG